MRKIIFAVFICIFGALTVQAQTPRPVNNQGTVASPATGSDGKIALIDSSAFNTEIGEMKTKIEALTAEVEPKRKELIGYQKQLDAIKVDLQSKSTSVSEAIKNKWIEQAQELEKTIKRKNEDYEAYLQKRGGELLQPIHQKIGAAIIKYAEAHNITIVLDSAVAISAGVLVFAAKSADITEDFIREYNKSNPVTTTSTAKK